MTTPKLQAYAYVTRPYRLVRQSLSVRRLEISRAATHAAAQRAGGIAASQRVELGVVEIATVANRAAREGAGGALDVRMPVKAMTQ